MVFLKRALCMVPILMALCGGAHAANSAAPGVRLTFDFESARIVGEAISTGAFDQAAFTGFCVRPDGKAIIRKLQLKDCDALLLHLKSFRQREKAVAGATALASELSKPANGKYAPLAAEVARQIKDYIPAGFDADLNVHFVYGSYSGGFAFEDVPNDVYINMERFPEATVQELAETVAHEVFHAVQAHVMKPESLPTARGPAAVTGPVWLRHWLFNLEQEGTAQLFTRPIADRPPTAHSANQKRTIARNAERVYSLVPMFESLGWRLLYVPPDDEDAYDQVYGLMFLTDFDETGYELGWLMASTIAKKDGKLALFDLLKEDPKQFLLRYQTIAAGDGKLPRFSKEFVQAVEAI